MENEELKLRLQALEVVTSQLMGVLLAQNNIPAHIVEELKVSAIDDLKKSVQYDQLAGDDAKDQFDFFLSEMDRMYTNIHTHLSVFEDNVAQHEPANN